MKLKLTPQRMYHGFDEDFAENVLVYEDVIKKNKISFSPNYVNQEIIMYSKREVPSMLMEKIVEHYYVTPVSLD